MSHEEVQVPPLHARAATFVALQLRPHAPQWLTLVVSAASQPLAALPSQLP